MSTRCQSVVLQVNKSSWSHQLGFTVLQTHTTIEITVTQTLSLTHSLCVHVCVCVCACVCMCVRVCLQYFQSPDELQCNTSDLLQFLKVFIHLIMTNLRSKFTNLCILRSMPNSSCIYTQICPHMQSWIHARDKVRWLKLGCRVQPNERDLGRSNDCCLLPTSTSHLHSLKPSRLTPSDLSSLISRNRKQKGGGVQQLQKDNSKDAQSGNKQRLSDLLLLKCYR